MTAYSLGNFISAQPFPNTEGGIIFDVTIQKMNQETTVTDYAYIPVLRYTPYENGRLKYYALPVSATEGNEDALKMPIAERQKWLISLVVFAPNFLCTGRKNGFSLGTIWCSID
ncbi:MAG: hypothetical protein HC817_00020 [Saprospiraceae bacterium]|nr:hypothetical protein [Saprospiraceae bacterium]